MSTHWAAVWSGGPVSPPSDLPSHTLQRPLSLFYESLAGRIKEAASSGNHSHLWGFITWLQLQQQGNIYYTYTTSPPFIHSQEINTVHEGQMMHSWALILMNKHWSDMKGVFPPPLHVTHHRKHKIKMTHQYIKVKPVYSPVAWQ